MKLPGKFIFLFLFLMLCGCSQTENERPPEKILSLSAAATRILYDLNVPPTAIDEYGVIAAGDPKPAVIGKGSAVSREKIAELGIDSVILWNYQQDSAQQFRKNGLQTLEISSVRLKDYPGLIRRLGEFTGRQKQAEELCDSFQKSLSALPDPEQKKNVYFELYGSFKSVGTESYTGDLLACAGGVLLNQKTGLISSEKLLAHQPEIIIYVEGYGSPDEFRKRPGFSELPAVKNNRFCAVPRRLITEGIAPLDAIGFFRKQITRE